MYSLRDKYNCLPTTHIWIHLRKPRARRISRAVYVPACKLNGGRRKKQQIFSKKWWKKEHGNGKNSNATKPLSVYLHLFHNNCHDCASLSVVYVDGYKFLISACCGFKPISLSFVVSDCFSFLFHSLSLSAIVPI